MDIEYSSSPAMPSIDFVRLDPPTIVVTPHLLTGVHHAQDPVYQTIVARGHVPHLKTFKKKHISFSPRLKHPVIYDSLGVDPTPLPGCGFLVTTRMIPFLGDHYEPLKMPLLPGRGPHPNDSDEKWTMNEDETLFVKNKIDSIATSMSVYWVQA